MITQAYGIEAWPFSLDVAEVQRHKAGLLDLSRRARDEGAPARARVASRGALYWQRWLLTKEPGRHEEARVATGLELAREAGDWKEADLLVAHAEASEALKDLPFVDHWRAIVAANLPEQVRDEEELEGLFQVFRRQPGSEPAELIRECADRIAAQGSPVAVNAILSRVCADLGLHDEAEAHLAALVVCRPLWIPYVVQLAEHQARMDLQRALRSIEAARRLFGPDFWLPL